jgi:molybdopterin-binding protein
MGQAAQLLGVSVDTLRRWADDGRLTTRRSGGGQRLVDGASLARLAVETGASAAQVELQAGPHRVVSLMTREAADELGLAPGVLAVAAVKATSVVVELPADLS